MQIRVCSLVKLRVYPIGDLGYRFIVKVVPV